ncbi:MAG: serine/threonine-protein kinase [Polyangiaceae bacterium]
MWSSCRDPPGYSEGALLTALSGRSPELEKYELIAEIGHGGMATVYRARDRRLGREVAVKVIHHHLRENKEVAARFVSEARAVAKVKHPNIVEVYDVSDADETERYLVQELVRGTTLRQLISERGHLPAEVAAAMAVEIAAALEHAHSLGVIHRDMKPENVLLDLPTEGQSEPEAILAPRVKITDFGIAKLLDVQGVTSTGQVLGSPAHMAPEQIEGGDVSASADVFGLGVLLYEACVGKLPFDGKNPAQVLRRVLDGAFTAADRARPTVGAGLSRIIGKALARDAADRYQSARALMEALKEELTQLGFTELRREIWGYLRDGAAYQKDYEPRLVTELCKRAGAARVNKDFVTTAASFNRALAFRPDDADLLRQVAQIARGVRLRRVLARGVAAVLAAGALLGVVAGAVAALRARHIPSLPLGSPALSPSAQVPALPSADAQRPNTVGSSEPRRVAAEPRRVGHILQPPRPAPSATVAETATVRVLVDGPKNATVKVDGQEIVWFGPPHELTVGPHTFEFVPPNEECCVAPQTMTVNVARPSDPAEVQTVRGTIEFKPALLDFQGLPGTTVSCGELGSFNVPSQQKIRMATASLHAHCTLLSPPTSGQPPKEFDVTLSPGRLFAIPGP